MNISEMTDFVNSKVSPSYFGEALEGSQGRLNQAADAFNQKVKDYIASIVSKITSSKYYPSDITKKLGEFVKNTLTFISEQLSKVPGYAKIIVVVAVGAALLTYLFKRRADNKGDIYNKLLMKLSTDLNQLNQTLTVDVRRRMLEDNRLINRACYDSLLHYGVVSSSDAPDAEADLVA